METLLVNLSKQVRESKLNDRDYLVAPLTLIVPGVLNGSKGSLYYPPEEITRDPLVWNHIPIVVNHPQKDGVHVSARSPEILNDFSVGIILNAKIVDDKLVAEGWFDVDATKRVDERIYLSLAANWPIELSTGLFTTNEPAPEGATFNGKSYDFVARGYRPDHLAILPDTIGACSLADGCGVLANALKDGGSLLLNQPSHDALRNQLNKLIQKLAGNSAWVEEVFNKYLIYMVDAKYYKIGYTVDMRSDNLISLSEQSPKEVIRTVTYKPPTNNSQKGEKTMALEAEQKKKIVDGLITNDCCFEESDREVLNSLQDETLEKLAKNNSEIKSLEIVANAAKTGFEDQQGNSHTYNSEKSQWETVLKEKEEEKKPVENAKEDTKEPQTTKEWLDSAPEEVRNSIKNAMAIEEKEKTEIIGLITANLEDDKKESIVKLMKTKTLDELHELAVLAPEQKTQVFNYTGAAVPIGNENKTGKRDRSKGLPLPVMEFSDKA